MLFPIIYPYSHQKKKKYIYIYIDKKYLLSPTFSGYSHFSLYILFLLLLVPILKNASRFPILVPSVTSEIKKADMTNDRNK